MDSPQLHSQQFEGPLLQLGRTRQHIEGRHLPYLGLNPVARDGRQVLQQRPEAVHA